MAIESKHHIPQLEPFKLVPEPSRRQFQLRTMMLGVVVFAVWLTLMRDGFMRSLMGMFAVSVGMMMFIIVTVMGLGWVGFLILEIFDRCVAGLKHLVGLPKWKDD